MEISPLQSIQFYGLWDQPRRVLVWEDITAKCYSWRRLREEIGLTPKELQTIQPSPQEWVTRGALQLADLPDMVCFPVNPFTHMHADLAEVWGKRWPAELLSQRIRDWGESAKIQGVRVAGKLKDAIDELEKTMIKEGLRRTNWNKSRLAKELGISRAGLIMKVDKYGLDKRKIARAAGGSDEGAA
jgi:DNA-binding protein Fis